MTDYERERAVMESYLAQAQEATMQGFENSLVLALMDEPTRRLCERFYRMGFASGWRIHEKHARGVSSHSEAHDAPVTKE